MDPHLYSAIRFVHMLGMAVWFAGALGVTGDIRKTLARGKPHTDTLVPRVERTLGIGTIAGFCTIASGVGMIFALGGFKAVRPTIHAGLALALIVLAVELFGIRPLLSKLGTALASGEGRALRSLAGRISVQVGLTHLFKLAILVLMVFRFG